MKPSIVLTLGMLCLGLWQGQAMAQGTLNPPPTPYQEPDASGGGKCPGVHEERRAQRDRGQRAADCRAGDAADEEARLPHTGGAAALVGVDDAQQQ